MLRIWYFIGIFVLLSNWLTANDISIKKLVHSFMTDDIQSGKTLSPTFQNDFLDYVYSKSIDLTFHGTLYDDAYRFWLYAKIYILLEKLSSDLSHADRIQQTASLVQLENMFWQYQNRFAHNLIVIQESDIELPAFFNIYKHMIQKPCMDLSCGHETEMVYAGRTIKNMMSLDKNIAQELNTMLNSSVKLFYLEKWLKEDSKAQIFAFRMLDIDDEQRQEDIKSIAENFVYVSAFDNLATLYSISKMADLLLKTQNPKKYKEAATKYFEQSKGKKSGWDTQTQEKFDNQIKSVSFHKTPHLCYLTDNKKSLESCIQDSNFIEANYQQIPFVRLCVIALDDFKPIILDTKRPLCKIITKNTAQ